MDRASWKSWSRASICYLALACVQSWLAGCASHGPYVWVKELPTAEGPAADYVVEPGDVLSIHVFNQDAMSTRARVRSDGRISAPFVGDVAVAGKTPVAVARELEGRLKAFVVNPVVAVMVDEFAQPAVAVTGEVTHPGVYNIDGHSGVLRALALAGGLTDYASHDNIYVLRHVGPRRVRFSYRALTENEPHAASFRLLGGDTVVVE
jgi:polysaccharide export outer membrane protein